MFGTIELRQPDVEPRRNWTRIVDAHLDSLAQPITARDLALMETAAHGRAAIAYPDMQRLLQLLRGVRNDQERVSIEGQIALLVAVRARASA